MILLLSFARSFICSSVTEDKIPLQCYAHNIVRFHKLPVLAWENLPGGDSAYAQSYNPSWVVASAGTGGRRGLLLRAQNCTTGCGKNSCCVCDPRVNPSYITFAELLNNDNETVKGTIPRFSKVTKDDVVLGPYNNATALGTEDPRIAYDVKSGIYYLFYTCYGYTDDTGDTAPRLCEAWSKNPTDATKWTIIGDIGFGDYTKSAALLLRETGPHYLYWGAGSMHLAMSDDPTNWSGFSKDDADFINGTLWGNRFVEAGPPPMKLSTGDYVLFHNSWPSTWKKAGGYEPAWVILDGNDPTKIIARAPTPLFSPSMEPWLRGDGDYYCNAPKVAFLEAAHPTGRVDEFRVYFGGADMVTGSAVVQMNRMDGIICNGTMPHIKYN